MAIADHIITSAIALARRGITAPGSSADRNGRKNRVRISRSVSHGHERAKHHDATIRNTVVGMPGTATPTAPSPTHATPPEAYAHRAARERVGVGRSWLGCWVCKSGRAPTGDRPR